MFHIYNSQFLNQALVTAFYLLVDFIFFNPAEDCISVQVSDFILFFLIILM